MKPLPSNAELNLRDHRIGKRWLGVHHQTQSAKCFWCPTITHIDPDRREADDAATLDHIIPRAGLRRGEHSFKNTCCACRKCNGARRNFEGPPEPEALRDGVPISPELDCHIRVLRVGDSPEQGASPFNTALADQIASVFGRAA